MPFFTYCQNNSYGSFDYNEANGVSVYVIIEADSAESANDKATDIGLYFDGEGDCPCCGDRWGPCGEGDACDEPEVYGRPVSEWDDGTKWIRKGFEAFVHYADGRVTGYRK
ncbi:DUF7296 family protein [Streptomyces chrestomyceticus]|uniref:DUF7296 family protein n=1 Tax=Streptomyces chrestomyceticus TaxID=68185 RepID=UPI0037AC02B9